MPSEAFPDYVGLTIRPKKRQDDAPFGKHKKWELIPLGTLSEQLSLKKSIELKDLPYYKEADKSNEELERQLTPQLLLRNDPLSPDTLFEQGGILPHYIRKDYNIGLIPNDAKAMRHPGIIYLKSEEEGLRYEIRPKTKNSLDTAIIEWKDLPSDFPKDNLQSLVRPPEDSKDPRYPEYVEHFSAILKQTGKEFHTQRSIPWITRSLGPQYILDPKTHSHFSDNSGLVSFTSGLEVVKNYQAPGNYMYMVRAVGGFNKAGFSHEKEVTVPGGVDAMDVIAFRRFESNFSEVKNVFSSNYPLYIRKNFINDYLNNPDLLKEIIKYYLEPYEDYNQEELSHIIIAIKAEEKSPIAIDQKSHSAEIKKEKSQSDASPPKEIKEKTQSDASPPKEVKEKKSDKPIQLIDLPRDYRANSDKELDLLIDYLSKTERKGNSEFESLKNEPLLREKVVKHLLATKSRTEVTGYLQKEDSLLIAWIKHPKNAEGSKIRQWFGKGPTSSYDKLLAAAGISLTDHKKQLNPKK
jgi:hypothetical protein